jgi:8-oxo-dGTP pyrophosphatase MutT (NUDIX family)
VQFLNTYPRVLICTQGGIDAGEEPRAAAVRELREETGVTSAEIVAEVS